MEVKQPNALEKLALARRDLPRVGSRLRAFPGFLPVAGGAAGRFSERLLTRYSLRPGYLSPMEMAYPKQGPSQPAQYGPRQMVLNQVTHNHPLTLSLRLVFTPWARSGVTGHAQANAHTTTRAANGPWRATSSTPLAAQASQPTRVVLRPASTRFPVDMADKAGDRGLQATGYEPPVDQFARTVQEQRRVMLVVAGPGPVHPSERTAPARREQGRIVLVTAAASDLVRPVVQRTERIPLVTGAANGHPRATSLPSAPVPRVVHKPQSAQVVEREAPTAAVDRALQSALRGAAHPVPWPGTIGDGSQPFLDQAGVHRLADQVVQVIDDRIIARRERLGRP